MKNTIRNEVECGESSGLEVVVVGWFKMNIGWKLISEVMELELMLEEVSGY